MLMVLLGQLAAVPEEEEAEELAELLEPQPVAREAIMATAMSKETIFFFIFSFTLCFLLMTADRLQQ